MAFREFPEGLLRRGVPVETQRFPRGFHLSKQFVRAPERLGVAVAGAALGAGLAMLGAVAFLSLGLSHAVSVIQPRV